MSPPRRIGDQVFIDDPKNWVFEPWTPQRQHQHTAARIAVGWLDKHYPPTQHLSPDKHYREWELHPIREIGNAAGDPNANPNPNPNPNRDGDSGREPVARSGAARVDRAGTPPQDYQSEVELGWSPDPRSPETLQAVRNAVNAKTGWWPSVQSRALAESAVVCAVALVYPGIREHEPARLRLSGGGDTTLRGAGLRSDPILHAAVLNSDGHIMAMVVVGYGQLLVDVRIDIDAATYPGALDDVEHGVRNLVGIPLPVAAIANPEAAADFATQTARLVAQGGMSPTVRVLVDETGDDSYRVRAEVGYVTPGKLALGSVLRSTVHFPGAMNSARFVGDHDAVAAFFGSGEARAAEFWQYVRDESGDTVGAVLGRAAVVIPSGDGISWDRAAAALRQDIDSLMDWQDKETRRSVVDAIDRSRWQVARSKRDAMIAALISGDPAAQMWTITIVTVVSGRKPVAQRAIQQINYVTHATNVTANERPEDAATRIVSNARYVIGPSGVPLLMLQDRICRVLAVLSHHGMRVDASRHGRRLNIQLEASDAHVWLETDGTPAVETKVVCAGRSGITTGRVRAMVDWLTDGMADPYRLAGAVAETLAGRLPQPLAYLAVTLKRDAKLLIKLQGSDFVDQEVSVTHEDHGASRLTVRVEKHRNSFRTISGDAEALVDIIAADNPEFRRAAATAARKAWSIPEPGKRTRVHAQIMLSGSSGKRRITLDLFGLRAKNWGQLHKPSIVDEQP